MLLSGKVAIVTGGSYGIGRGIARVFVENGAEVIICARREKRLEEAKAYIQENTGKETLTQVCNVSHREDVERVTDFAMRTFGRIDILVNNAGVQRFSPFLEISDKHWDEHFAVNTKGVFLFTQVVARKMVEVRKGKIINISSDSGCYPTPNDAAAYCASKTAVISLTRNVAKELGPSGVYCNCICPGAIGDTAMMDYFTSYTKGDGIQQCIDASALRRMGTPEDIGNAALFLASDLSNFITGEKLLVTGGDLMSQ